MASAGDGLTPVGANVIVLPSTYWDGDIEWKAWTWVYNSQTNYGTQNDMNPNYNMIVGIPEPDAQGREWYEPDFDMGPKEDDRNFDIFDEETGEPMPILWEENTAPYSSDATYNGRPSYRWTTTDIMADIYVRRVFTTDQLLAGPVYLACGHDDAPAEYYINGELVFQRTGYEGAHEDAEGNTRYANGWNNAEYIQLTDEQKALIKLNGEENVIAFHVHQNWGGAFADCGLYTKVEGGLDMGFTTPWEGKVLFNNTGGYNNDLASPSNNPKHPWSALYEAQEGDVYSFVMPGHSEEGEVWMEQLHFKTPIRIQEDHTYSFKAKLEADKEFSSLIVKLTDNDDDNLELAYEERTIEVGEPTELEIVFSDMEVSNFKIVFDFGGGQDSAKVTIKEISLVDIDEDKELWVGTHYFNYFYMNHCKYRFWDFDLNDGEGGYREPTEEEIEWAETYYELADAPEIEGRVETLAWAQADFDDSMWDEQMMPTGSAGYMDEQQSIWPEGIAECYYSSNYWIRRNFELDKINERLSYELNVLHDDVYETYVNGHLLQKNVGWTNGKNPVQVHIPAKYLNVGKNVIATYIQQNWGGYFYDCGINVTEVNYEECVSQFNNALAYAKTDTLLTNKMRAEVQAIIDQAMQNFEENKNDPAEIRNLARELTPEVNKIFAYSKDVKVLKDTYELCSKLEDKGYWGTSLEDAVAALDTCATASQLSPYVTALREARKATAMERHTEKYVGTVPVAVEPYEVGDEYGSNMYYIYNVGQKLFLGGGETWGTHLALEYISNPMTLVKAERDILDENGDATGDTEIIEGAFRVETFRPNGIIGEADFMGWNGYIDCNTQDSWELVPVEGKENVFNIARHGVTREDGSKYLLGFRNGDNELNPSYYVVDTDMKTPELEDNQWMFITREEMLSFIAAASEENPVDLSFLIQNPGYDQRLSIDLWTFFGGSVFGRGANYSNFVLESYNSDEFENSQDIWPDEEDKALPAGTYVLSVQGYYRDGIEEAHVKKVVEQQPISQRAFIYAGPSAHFDDPGYYEDPANTIPLMPIHIEANMVPGIGYTYGGLTMPGTYSGQPHACAQAAEEYFNYGLYQNKLLFTISEDDPGHIAIGIYKDFDENRPNGDWVVMDNWRLKYYGKGEINDPDAIKGIVSDEINKESKAGNGIYNLLGQKMSKAQQGVNIIGGKKVALK